MNDENLKKVNTCKNCGNKFSGRFCNNCGEKVYSNKDKKIWHLIEEVTHFITHFEGTLFNTLRVLFTRPGKLSLDYCNGIRKKYFKPVSFFLLLVVIYLLFPVFEGLNQKLFYHMNSPFYGGYATQKIKHLQEESGLSMEQISTAFQRSGERVSKFLLLLFLPISGILLNLLLFRKRRLFFDHFIFATEINIIFLLWGFLLFPFILMWYRLFSGTYLSIPDVITGTVLFIIMGFYMTIAAKRFYDLKYWRSIILSIAFLVLYLFLIMYIYKFILFILVFWQIS